MNPFMSESAVIGTRPRSVGMPSPAATASEGAGVAVVSFAGGVVVAAVVLVVGVLCGDVGKRGICMIRGLKFEMNHASKNDTMPMHNE